MKILLLIISILLLMTGCMRTERINGSIVEVQGVGVDTTFYPVFSVRVGVYKYIIVQDDGKKSNNNVVIIK